MLICMCIHTYTHTAEDRAIPKTAEPKSILWQRECVNQVYISGQV